MNKTKPKITRLGNDIMSLDWSFGIEPKMHQKILALADDLRTRHPKQIRDIASGYQSLLVTFKNGFLNDDIHEEFRKIDLSRFDNLSVNTNRWFIPVYYHESVGQDLKLLAEEKKMSTEDLIRSHSSVHYRIYFTGFLPGFPYLGGLPKLLHTPRKQTPALSISAGSVGIGGAQTGIYPVNSPGGWHIIGKTPVRLFDIHKAEPVFLKAGDEIIFEPIDKDAYLQIKGAVNAGHYEIRKELIHD